MTCSRAPPTHFHSLGHSVTCVQMLWNPMAVSPKQNKQKKSFVLKLIKLKLHTGCRYRLIFFSLKQMWFFFFSTSVAASVYRLATHTQLLEPWSALWLLRLSCRKNVFGGKKEARIQTFLLALYSENTFHCSLFCKEKNATRWRHDVDTTSTTECSAPHLQEQRDPQQSQEVAKFKEVRVLTECKKYVGFLEDECITLTLLLLKGISETVVL